MMSNEPDTPAEHEKPIERTDANVLVRLLTRERARITKEIDEADGDASVDVQDQLQNGAMSMRISSSKEG